MPACSRDSSIFYLGRKLKEIGFKAELNNSNGFGADKGRYIGYDFKEEELNFKKLLPEFLKNASSLKLEGLDSTSRQPSLGDYQKYLSEAGFLHVYGSIDFLNNIKFPSVLENISTSKAKLLIISDHLNYRKSIINKFYIYSVYEFIKYF